ncbi:MAG: polysaccharide deacetylase [Hespellia sp.]|nr:polysaccharide deacetylase [Hespellia sp.]
MTQHAYSHHIHFWNTHRAHCFICAILFFLVGCSAATLHFSGIAADSISRIKFGATPSSEVVGVDPKKIYSREKENQPLSSITILKPASGLLRIENSDRTNLELTPGLAVGSSTQSDEKVVYLTFDDGPSSNTKAVLDVLEQYDAKATFFVTGMNPDYDSLIKTAADSGHTIGLHTMSHDYSKIYASEDAYFRDLTQIGNLVKEQIGYVPCFVRFPGGSSNTVSAKYASGIMTRLSKEVIARGYQYYDWNSDSEDGSGNLTPDQIYTHAIAATANNIIILCHDAKDKETTIKALPKIIEHYQADGYIFCGLDRESYAPHHRIHN